MIPTMVILIFEKSGEKQYIESLSNTHSESKSILGCPKHISHPHRRLQFDPLILHLVAPYMIQRSPVCVIHDTNAAASFSSSLCVWIDIFVSVTSSLAS